MRQAVVANVDAEGFIRCQATRLHTQGAGTPWWMRYWAVMTMQHVLRRLRRLDMPTSSSYQEENVSCRILTQATERGPAMSLHRRALALLFSVAIIASPLHAKEKVPTMPNGTWKIDASVPATAVEVCPEFLPSGTRIRLRTEGPTRLAIEEQRRDELGGVVTLLPPFSSLLCRTGIGRETGFGANLCAGGTLPSDLRVPVEFDDAVFVFSRLDAGGVADPDNEFFVDRGARRGARFATVFLRYKSVQWHLWVKSPNEMVSECLVHLPGKNNIDSIPMIWRREARD